MFKNSHFKKMVGPIWGNPIRKREQDKPFSKNESTKTYEHSIQKFLLILMVIIFLIFIMAKTLKHFKSYIIKRRNISGINTI